MVKNLPTMRETWVWSVDWEDPMKKGNAIHSSVLAWRIPQTEESGRLLSMGSQRVGRDWATFTFHFTFMAMEEAKSSFQIQKLFSCYIMSDSFVTPWTTAHQAPLSTGFPRQEYWSGVPFPSSTHHLTFLLANTSKRLESTKSQSLILCKTILNY